MNNRDSRRYDFIKEVLSTVLGDNITVFKKGEVVEHAKFGRGRVIKVVGENVTVAFKKPYGVKTIYIGHSSISKMKLKKVV